MRTIAFVKRLGPAALAARCCTKNTKASAFFFSRHFLVLLLLFTLSGLFVPASGQITITVNSTGDAHDANGGAGPCADLGGGCTLRAAIETASLNPPPAGTRNVIEFSLPLPAVILVTEQLMTIADLHIKGQTINDLPTIELNGGGVNANGLNVYTNCIVEGLNIHGFLHDGINVQASGNSENSIIRNNFIGTSRDGLVGLGNGGAGIFMTAGQKLQNNSILNNLIAANAKPGIDILGPGAGANNNIIRGNKIGTNAAGTAAIPNTGQGIFIHGTASNNEVGGSIAGQENLISGNLGNGIEISNLSTSTNRVQNNIIGANRTRSAAIPNGGNGVAITDQSSDNVIKGNKIEGNKLNGVFIGTGTTNNAVLTNFIGSASMPNKGDGIKLSSSKNDILSGNNIGNNDGNGISIDNSSTTTVTGNTLFGNLKTGIALQNGASANFIGGIGALQTNDVNGNFTGGITINGVANTVENNKISFNNFVGVAVSAGTGNAILSNSIFSNIDRSVPPQKINGLGIDLGGSTNSVTPNDTKDPDVGANNLQNFPVLTYVGIVGGPTTINGTLNSTPNTLFRIEFFANSNCDPSAFGEGEYFLGFTTVKTDVDGNASFSVAFALPGGTSAVTATATDPNGNTSEFSACHLVHGLPPPAVADLAVTKTANKATFLVGENIVYTITLKNNGPAQATNIKVSEALPVSLLFVQAAASAGSYDNGTGLWTIPSLNNGSQATLSLTAKTTIAETVENKASVAGSDQTDLVNTNNTGSVSVLVQPSTSGVSLADLAVTKTVDNARPVLGEKVMFTVTLSNNGPQSSTRIMVKDQVPAGMAFSSATPSVGTYNLITGYWTLPFLANGSNAKLLMETIPIKTGSISNAATNILSSDTRDLNGANNQSFVSIVVQGTQDFEAYYRAMSAQVNDLVLKAKLSNDNGQSLLALLQTSLQQARTADFTGAIANLQAFIASVNGIVAGGSLSLYYGQLMTSLAQQTIVLLTAKLPLVVAGKNNSLQMTERQQGGIALLTYPNPFKGSTRISFSLLTASRVHLAVYDANGRLVQLLSNRMMPAGLQSLNWQPKSLAAGIYSLQLTAGGSRKTQRLVCVN